MIGYQYLYLNHNFVKKIQFWKIDFNSTLRKLGQIHWLALSEWVEWILKRVKVLFKLLLGLKYHQWISYMIILCKILGLRQVLLMWKGTHSIKCTVVRSINIFIQKYWKYTSEIDGLLYKQPKSQNYGRGWHKIFFSNGFNTYYSECQQKI